MPIVPPLHPQRAAFAAAAALVTIGLSGGVAGATGIPLTPAPTATNTAGSGSANSGSGIGLECQLIAGSAVLVAPAEAQLGLNCGVP